ncbi:uncharacterized protein [Primulina eburnea]|uniref:uncharacterized protein isoform X4 n=1 Tax=Primulina eburnea TaxID=1245227 RepID=UPI003C6C79D4
MSRLGQKRSKVSVDEVQENIANKLSRGDSNTPPNSSEYLRDKELIDDAKTNKKKGRGSSKFNLVSGQQQPKDLERNEFGQAIGDNSVKYASFLGCMVKEFVPYTLDRWNDLNEEMKNKMWRCLQLNYKVEEWEKHSIFQKLGKLWRDRKSKLQILIREVHDGRVASRDLCLLKPEFMDQNQWDLFVKKTLSPAFQEKSGKFKAMREKQRHNHTMSRRGYARLAHIMEQTSSADIPITRTKVWVEGHKKKNGQPSGEAVGEKMKEIEECAPESQNTANIAEDAISLVFGKEIRGRVRGMGFGVTPSKVGASLQQNGTIKQLQSMMHNLQQEVQQMRSIVFQNMRQQNEQEQSNLKNVSHGDIPENTKCKLLHWCGDGVVAEGRIASTDSTVKVHHVPLGGSCWKVWVDKVLVEQVDLIRPNSEMIFLDDAVGSTVAWFSKFIVLCD